MCCSKFWPLAWRLPFHHCPSGPPLSWAGRLQLSVTGWYQQDLASDTSLATSHYAPSSRPPSLWLISECLFLSFCLWIGSTRYCTFLTLFLGPWQTSLLSYLFQRFYYLCYPGIGCSLLASLGFRAYPLQPAFYFSLGVQTPPQNTFTFSGSLHSPLLVFKFKF